MLAVVNLLNMDVRNVFSPQRRRSSQTQPHHPVKQTRRSGSEHLLHRVLHSHPDQPSPPTFEPRRADLYMKTGGPAGESPRPFLSSFFFPPSLAPEGTRRQGKRIWGETNDEKVSSIPSPSLNTWKEPGWNIWLQSASL